MSGSKQRKARQGARQKAGRAQWMREQEQQAQSRRPHTMLTIGVLTALAAAVSVVAGLIVAIAGDGLDQREISPGGNTEPSANAESLASEAAADAQASASDEAVAAGEVLAEDYGVEPGTPMDSGVRPPTDERPVACGARAPANARATRPRYPGGPADVLRDGVDYVARIDTSCGPITIDLMEQGAPVAVNSFVFLAQEGFYDGLEFFRDFGGIAAAQAGSGDNTLAWDIGYLLPDELGLAERDGYPIGTVTTAGEGPYTAGSDFYIVYGDEFNAGFRNRSQTSFGRVLSGMEVIYTMTAMYRTGLGGEAYAERLFIESVTVEER